MNTDAPRILVFSSDDASRARLTKSVARALDVEPISCHSIDEVRDQSLGFRADVIVVDHAPNDPHVASLLKWLKEAGIRGGLVHLSDDQPQDSAKGLWLTRDVRGHVLGDAVSRQLVSSAPKPRKTNGKFDAFRVTLDDLEKALDDVNSTLDVVKSLRDTHELLAALNLGPPTREMASVVTDDQPPSEDDVRAFISQLKALVGERDPTQARIMLCGRDERVARFREMLEPHATVSHVVHRDSLVPACELLAPHVVAVFDENDRQTRETLVLLRQILPGLSPTVALLGRPGRPVDRHLAYEIEAAFDADVPLATTATALINAAHAVALKAPRILIVDEDGSYVEVNEAVERMGGRAVLLEDPTRLLRFVSETTVDAVVLSPSYAKVSGFDLCRSLRAAHGSSIPIVFLADHADHTTRSEAFRAGGDDVIALPWVIMEVQRRIRHLVELRRLRAQVTHRDNLTGVQHISGFKAALKQVYEALGAEQQVSFAGFEVCNFAELRAKHGEACGRTVLRHVADTLAQNFDEEFVFRGWGERFFVISSRVLSENSKDTPWAPILDISRVTFRDASGRGFYASVNAAHLVAPPGHVSVNGCIEGLLRILSRCGTLGSAQLLTARIDSPTDGAPLSELPASNPARRWKPVVLTREDD